MAESYIGKQKKNSIWKFFHHIQMQISAHECYPSTCQNKDATDNTLRTETPCLFIMENIFFS